MHEAVMQLRKQHAADRRAVLDFEEIDQAAAFDAKRMGYLVQKEKYEAALREMRAFLSAEADKYAANIEVRGFRRPIIQQQIVVVADKGPEYRAAKQALMSKLFADRRTRTMDGRALRVVYLRESERQAAYLGELPASIWNRPFREWEQAVADRSLIASALIATNPDGTAREVLNTFAKIHNRIVERAKPAAKPARGAAGKNFGKHGRVEFLSGKRVAWFGSKPLAYRGEGASIRLTIKDGTARKDIRIVKTLSAAPFNVKPETIARWIANAETQAAHANYSPIEAQRDDFGRFTGSREL
ncbi:hypothetical protein [Robbsia sp. KACC 23696]|uniref:hypothetical protein n=1 Tax=Robbsia sp. KACC 23696 TaxID=3149231 RepID=UPI00325BAECA